MIESLTKSVPFLVKLFALIMGGVIALALSGDIDLDNTNQVKLNLNAKVFLKLMCSIGIGLYLGEFTIDYWDFDDLNHYAQSAILMAYSVFGMLVFGVIYRSLQLTLADKQLDEIVSEIKEIIKALLR